MRGLDERLHISTVKALLTAVQPHPVYDFDEVPGRNRVEGTPPPMYVLLTLERRTNPMLRAVGMTDRTGWRLRTRAVTKTVDECRWLSLKVTEGIGQTRLAIDGLSSTPLLLESHQAAEFDEGDYTAFSDWTYAL